MSRAASGLQAWWLQRVSALYLALFSLILIGHFIFNPPLSYADWKAWVAEPLTNTGLLLFLVALVIHAWVGVRDVLVDYVKPPVVRIALLTLIAGGLLFCSIRAASVLLQA